jgi:hypothetical protein
MHGIGELSTINSQTPFGVVFAKGCHKFTNIIETFFLSKDLKKSGFVSVPSPITVFDFENLWENSFEE